MRRRMLRVLAGVVAATVPMALLPSAPAYATVLGAGSSYSTEYLVYGGISATRVFPGGDVPLYGGATSGGFYLTNSETVGVPRYTVTVVPGYIHLAAGGSYSTVQYSSNQSVTLTVTTPSCTVSTGTLTVIAAGYSADGVLESFAGSYDAVCGSGRLVGHLRWNDPTPYAAVTAPMLSYGHSAVGAPRTSTVTVTAEGTAPLELGAAELSGQHPSVFAVSADRCAGSTLAPGDSCEIDVTFTPEVRQAYGAALRVPAPGRPQGPVQIALTGNGEVPPAAPADLGTFPATDGVSLVWAAPTGTTVTGYRVYRSTAGGEAVLLGSPTVREWADVTLAPGVSATYAVSAVNAAGEGARTAGVDGTPLAGAPAPGSVMALTRDAANNYATSVTQVWTTMIRTRPAMDLTRLATNGVDALALDLGRVPGPGIYPTRPSAASGFVVLRANNCMYANGSLAVREVAYDAAGILLTMDATWQLEAGCAGYQQFGEIRYAAASGYAALQASPAWNAGAIRTGTSTAPHRFTITNVGTVPVPLYETSITTDAEHWAVSADTCSGVTLAPAGSCTVDVAFSPTRNGNWRTTLRVADGTAAGARFFGLGGSNGTEPAALGAPTAYAASGRAWISHGTVDDWGNGTTNDVVVYRGSTADDLAPVSVPPAPYLTNAFYDTGLKPGSRYYYAVAARNEYGLSPRSAVVAVDVPADEVLFLGGNYAGGPLRVISASGGEARELDGGASYEPALSPDGRWLAYTVDVGWGSSYSSKLYVRPIDGSADPRALVTSTGWQLQPSWSPDGRTVVFTRYIPRSYGADIDLATVGFAGGSAAPVPGSAGLANAAYSPDGRSLIAEYVGSDGMADPRLVRINRDGTGRADVTGGAGGASPAVSKDGRIAFVHRADWTQARSSLRLLPWAGGSPVVALAADWATEDPTWSPDGSHLYASRSTVDVHGAASSWSVVSLPPSELATATVLTGPGSFPQARIRDAAPPIVRFDTAPTTLLTQSLRLTFTVTDDTTAIGGLTRLCSLDGAAYVSCAGAFSRDGLPAGKHSLVIRAVDLAGNVASVTHAFTVDLAPPVVRMTSPRAAVTMATSVTARLSATDVSGVTTYALRYRPIALNGTGTWVYPAAWQQMTTGVRTLAVTPGVEYCFAGRARDGAGRWSGWSAQACTSVPLDDRSLAASAGWSRGTLLPAWRGTVTSTTTAGRGLRTPTLSAKRVAVVATRCPTCGRADVYVNGRLTGRVDLRTTTTLYRGVLWLPTGGAVSGVVSLRTVAAGKRVQVDGFVIDH